MTPADADTPLLEFRGVGRSFFGVPVLRDVSLALGAGRVLGLVGENGAGKSTLMNLLGGVHQPDAGTMRLAGAPYAPRRPRDAAAAGVAFIHQELNLFANLSVAENLHLGAFPRRRAWGISLPLIDRAALRARTAELLARVSLDVSPDALVAALSPGQRQLVEIAKAVALRARVVIFDEPTTSLTAPEVAQLFRLIRQLRDGGAAVVYISHNLADVRDLCDDVAVLRDGQLVSTGPRAAYGEDRVISEMVGRSIERLFPARAGAPREEVVLRVEGLAAPPAVRGVSFALRRGEILGLAGLMGAGRTEVARALFGLDPVAAGTIALEGRPLAPAPRACIARGMALLTEDRRAEGLLMEASVVDNAALVALPTLARGPLAWLGRRALRRRVAAATAAVRVQAGVDAARPVRTLSGGNQQKVVLAKWLMVGPRVILLDEPTRGIDVGAKQEVYRIVQQLADDGVAILLISSEIEELIGLCDRILVLARGRLRDELARLDFDRERILRAALHREEPAPA